MSKVTAQSAVSPLDAVLTDIERVELGKFADNIIMSGAVKKVLLFGMYYNGTLRKGESPEMTMNFALQDVYSELGPAMSNEKLGENLRAKSDAILMLKGGFDRLEDYQTPEALKTKEKGGHR